jgi:transposase-like protein
MSEGEGAVRRYTKETRAAARRLWLRGGKTDQEIAGLIGVDRHDTIRDWRAREDWEADRHVMSGLVDDAVKQRLKKDLTELNDKHDRLAEVVEVVGARILTRKRPDGEPAATAADVRAIASALESTQKVRRMARGLKPFEKPEPPAKPMRRIEWVLGKPPEGSEERKAPKAGGPSSPSSDCDPGVVKRGGDLHVM